MDRYIRCTANFRPKLLNYICISRHFIMSKSKKKKTEEKKIPTQLEHLIVFPCTHASPLHNRLAADYGAA